MPIVSRASCIATLSVTSSLSVDGAMPGVAEHVFHVLDQTRGMELTGRQVHADHQAGIVALPHAEITAGGLEDVLSEPDDQAALFGNRR